MANEKRNIKVKAKVNLKYDKDIINIGQEFKVKEEEVLQLIKEWHIELIDKLPEVKELVQEDKKDKKKSKGGE